MNDLLTTWSYGNSEIRTIKREDGIWFVGKDICNHFGDTNSNRSIGRLDPEDKITIDFLDSMNRLQPTTFINESGLYSLLFSMQPQKANKDGVQDAYPIETLKRIESVSKFKHWVTSEVLPTIRKTGGYGNEVVTVTPDLAREWLNHNVQNRKINMANVKRMADDIRNGKFYLNGDTIRFYDDGTLADGQHRLTACVLADMPIKTYVIRNLPKDVIATIDCGRNRNMVDSLNIKGCTINRELVPAMNLYFNRTAKLTAGQCEELWNRYETEFTQLSNILKGSHHDYILSQREVRAYCVHLALSEKWNMNQIQDFVTGLKRKPNCVTNFDYTCYNFRNFYDRHVHNKLRDTKKFGEKTKMAHTLNALTIVADSYKTGKIYKSFAFKPTAKAILDKGCEIAQSCLSIAANTQLALE